MNYFRTFATFFCKKKKSTENKKIIKYQPIKIKILMKKCYNFLMALATIVLCLGVNFASAQEIIFSEDFATVTGSGTQQCETSGTALTSPSSSTTLQDVLPGWTGDYVYPANGKVKLSTGSNAGWLQTPDIDLTNYPSVRISFQARAWNGSDATTMTVLVGDAEYEITGLPNSGSTSNVECDLASFSIIATGGSEKAIKFQAVNRLFIDNIVVTPATTPVIEVQGTTTFTNVPVNQEVSGSLTVLGYNLTAGATTEVSLTGATEFTLSAGSYSNDDLMSEEGVTLPFTFSAAEAGTYTTTVSFSNSDLAEATTVTLTATVISVNEITTIAGLRALVDNSNVDVQTTDSVFYKYTGHAYVTQAFQTGNNTKWMQDSTGAVQLYDPDGHLSNVAQGVEITNVVGWIVNYYGYVELNVKADIANSDINAFPSNIPEPVTITIEQLLDQTYMDGIQGQLVKMENVTFNETGTFDRYGFYTVTHDGTTDTAVYVTSNFDNIKGQDVPTDAVNIIGVNMRTAAYSNGYQSPRLPSRYYILPRELAPVTGISENGKTLVSVYPNPTTDNVTLNIGGEATTVSVYNVMGTLVSTQSVSYGANTVNMSSMPAGVYFLRITNGNEAVGTVKVVRQ